MKIVIDIPKKIYEELKTRNVINAGETFSQKLIKYIRNGIPLPKGHGDLKDADNLKHAFVMWSMAVQGNFTDIDIASIICNSPIVIPADKE